MSSDITLAYAQKLIAAASVSALVGDRVRPIALDQTDTMPAIIYSLVTTDNWHGLSGGTYGARSRLQYFCYGENIEESVSVSSAIISELDGFRGEVGSLFVSSSMLQNIYDMVDPPTKGSAAWRYRRVIDFSVCHNFLG